MEPPVLLQCSNGILAGLVVFLTGARPRTSGLAATRPFLAAKAVVSDQGPARGERGRNFAGCLPCAPVCPGETCSE